jgi:DNA repair exonuclease SbcCD nuclease subunit
MGRPLREIRDLASSLKVPVICAGDIFDRWNSPPELINFALENLPFMYAVPGQHDLPSHRTDLIQKSAYHTLELAGRIKTIPSGGMTLSDDLSAHGFGWGCEVTPPYGGVGVGLAVVHSFIWTDDYGYPGAPMSATVKQFKKKLKGYDAAVFGDNHKGFLAGSILNCGTLFRRKADEISYRPSIGVLFLSGAMDRRPLRIEGEYIESLESVDQPKIDDFGDFMKHLGDLRAEPLSFREFLERCMGTADEGVRKILTEVLT